MFEFVINGIKVNSYTESMFRSNDKYEEICNAFLSLDISEKRKSILIDILYKGQYKDYYIGLSCTGRANTTYNALARLSFAYLLLKNPDTFTEIINGNVQIFHGTNSNALPSIIKNGLISYKKAVNKGIEVTTGEEMLTKNGKRDFVSFSDVLDVAETYSLIDSNADDEIMSFPVVLGMKMDDSKFHRNLLSDVSEFATYEDIKFEDLDVILVPKEKTEIVKKMVENSNVKVLPLDDIQKKFYSMKFDFDVELVFDEERYHKIKEHEDFREEFDLEDIKSFVLSEWGKDCHKKNDKTINEDLIPLSFEDELDAIFGVFDIDEKGEENERVLIPFSFEDELDAIFGVFDIDEKGEENERVK